jgi:NADPH:quinone reductase
MLPAATSAITITAAGGPGMLTRELRPVPHRGACQVLIKVACAGIERHDCSQRKRRYGPEGATDIPGLEIAGEIAAIGPDVTRWKPGDRACALANGGGYRHRLPARTNRAKACPLQ